MQKIKYLLLIPILIPLGYGFGKEFIHEVILINYFNIIRAGFYLPFLISLRTSCFFLAQASYFSILKHELIHNLFALLTFNKPHGLVVNRGGGGEFSYSGDGNILIALSPYFFPLLSFCWVPISLLHIGNISIYISILGILFGLDVSTSVKDMHFEQTDFKPYGLLVPALFISMSIFIFWGSIIAFSQNGFHGIEKYFIGGVSNVISGVSKIAKYMSG